MAVLSKSSVNQESTGMKKPGGEDSDKMKAVHKLVKAEKVGKEK